MINDNILYNYLSKFSQQNYNYNGEITCCVSQKHCVLLKSKTKNAVSIYFMLTNKMF